MDLRIYERANLSLASRLSQTTETMAGALTENIAVLSLCKTTCDPITEIDLLTEYGNDAKNYALSIQQEQKIAEAFAILLANTDDPNTVGAICLEEQPDRNGLLIRTAVNSGLQKERTANFAKIADSLRQCAAGSFSDLNQAKTLTIWLRKRLRRLLRGDCHYLQSPTAHPPTIVARKNASKGR